ncbi:MAG TPA: hypothetical protein VF115_14830 [Acidimicrobiia bacterium]
MDTEAIASEIVYLKNRIAELDEESVEEKQRLHERLRRLQDQLSSDSPDDLETDSHGDEVQYLPPA